MLFRFLTNCHRGNRFTFRDEIFPSKLILNLLQTIAKSSCFTNVGIFICFTNKTICLKN